jgi:hypothetical protein
VITHHASGYSITLLCGIYFDGKPLNAERLPML